MQQVKVNKNPVVISLEFSNFPSGLCSKKSPEMLKVGKITYIISILISGTRVYFQCNAKTLYTLFVLFKKNTKMCMQD